WGGNVALGRQCCSGEGKLLCALGRQCCSEEGIILWGWKFALYSEEGICSGEGKLLWGGKVALSCSGAVRKNCEVKKNSYFLIAIFLRI
ncbi:MAG TPA: hypothetical protein PLR86_12010, partial [Planctomycetota bacterium]|nr:hypothetical protein [Planctomycetota bacterium]